MPPCREKFLSEIRNLERAKDDMTVEQAFMMDRFRQMQVENERLKEEMAAFKTRLGNATEDYVRSVRRLWFTPMNYLFVLQAAKVFSQS